MQKQEKKERESTRKKPIMEQKTITNQKVSQQLEKGRRIEEKVKDRNEKVRRKDLFCFIEQLFCHYFLFIIL